MSSKESTRQLNIACKMLKGNDVVVEVGSHIGDGVKEFYKKTKKVYAIEPNFESYNQLKKICDKAFNFAISGKTGVYKLYKLKKHSRCTSLNGKVRKLKKENAQVDRVTVKSMDDFIEEQNIKHVRLMRFDCYGAEYSIFEERTDFLKYTDIILITIHNKGPFEKMDKSVITDKLEKNGFKLIEGNLNNGTKHIHQIWECRL